MPPLVEARSQLEGMGAPAVRAIFSALATEPATPTTLEVLESLVRQDTLPALLDGLRSGQTHVENAATRVLGRSSTFDMTQLFALFSDQRVPRSLLESILDGQAVHARPAALLRVLPALGKEARNSAFRVLERTADKSILAEAIALSKHEEWWIRLHVAKLLANQPGPAANAAMAKLVRDENGAVRLEAVRGGTAHAGQGGHPSLCTRLRDQDLKVQTAAIETLVSLRT
jgi:HEAT repeat protein